MLDGAARGLGCTVIAGGTGNSEQQVQAIAHFRPTAYTGTPDLLKVLLDKAVELGLDCSSITRGLDSGGALFPALRPGYARPAERRGGNGEVRPCNSRWAPGHSKKNKHKNKKT